jgi:transcriptional regulator with XRE-family HTH domain
MQRKPGEPAMKKRQQVLVGSKIRELRKSHQLTQSELATRIGVQQSDLCRMETGEYRVSLDTLFKILSIFQLNIGEFFQEESPAALSEDERAVLHMFRQLGEPARGEFREYLKFRIQSSDPDPHSST